MQSYKLSVSVGWPGSKSLVKKRHFRESYTFPLPPSFGENDDCEDSTGAQYATGRASLDAMVQEALFSSARVMPSDLPLPLKSVDLTTDMEDDDFDLESMGVVFCALPLTSPYNGTKFMLMGSQNGVWVQSQSPNEKEPSLFRRVIEAENVQQLGFLREANLLVVRSEEELWAHRLDFIVPQWNRVSSPPASAQGMKLAGRVAFFSILRIANKTLILFEMRGINSTSTLRMFELPKRLDTVGGVPRFKVLKDWNAGKPIHAVAVLGSKLAVLGDSTVELVDIINRKEAVKVLYDSRSSRTSRIPNIASRTTSEMEGRPIGVFRTGYNEYLICHTEFGVFVDGQGDPIMAKNGASGRCTWDLPSVENVTFNAPFLYLFSPECIQIRRLLTPPLPSAGRWEIVHSLRESEVRLLSTSSPRAPQYEYDEGPEDSEQRAVVVSMAAKCPGVEQDVFKVAMY